MHPGYRLIVLGSALLFAACGETTLPGPPEPAFVGASLCRDCHTEQYADWQGSHHDLAMQIAGPATVLGDFNAASFDYFDIDTRFFRRDGSYIVRTPGADGRTADFEVTHTFGVTPLQQYLVALPGGRLQALPFAWDSRAIEAGGQRWLHLYSDEYIGPGNPLHWTGREQNWNYMCAECHSTNVEMSFDVSSNSFAHTSSELNVSCEACHGPGSTHVYRQVQKVPGSGSGFPVNLDDRGRAIWQMNHETGIAERSELAMRPPQQPESCGRCHSRRGVVATVYEYGERLSQTHRVALLDDPLYFDDGQIREEVYVYGSFLQSRMYRAGVTCSDCHNPHSLELVTGDDSNNVCAQCHLPARFDVAGHHRHVQPVVACVDCHMPETTYMAVDPRRDHSLRIPRPDLSMTTNAPNACNGCHTDRDTGWAARVAEEWWGDPASGRSSFANAFHDARSGFANPELIDVIGNTDIAGIARATALTLLSGPFGQNEASAIERAMRDADELVRRGALQAARGLAGEDRVRVAGPLLADPVRSIRIEAAVLLAPFRDYLPQGIRLAFATAADEFRLAQAASASRPEAHTNLGDFEANLGRFEVSLQHHERALEMAPQSAQVRINFADTLRRMGDEQQAEAILRDGLVSTSDEAGLRHALGLLLVRTRRVEDGLVELQEAASLAPGNSRYAYVAAIALNSTGQSARAVALLEAAMQDFGADFDIAWALATILRDRAETDRALDIARQLADRYPDNQGVAALVDSLATYQAMP